jgi:hypothetical protein
VLEDRFVKKRIVAALTATAALLLAWQTAGAVAYNMFGWFQRSSGGVLSSLLWKAGTAQGCPNYPASAPSSNIQPCYNPNIVPAAPRDWQDNFSKDPSQTGYSGQYFSAVPNADGVITAIINAGQATWDWNSGTQTLTGTGLFWATSSIDSNPSGTQVLSDRVTNLVINAAANTTAAATYGCIEGIFLVTVGTSGCLTVNTVASNNNATSTATYNIGADPSCISRTIGTGDTSTGTVRGLYDRAGGGGCDAITNQSSMVQYDVIQDDGDVLILADTPISEIADPDPNDPNDTADVRWPYTLASQFGGSWPAITITGPGNCMIWGPQANGTSAYNAGGTFTPTGAIYNGSYPRAPCPPNHDVRGISYLVFFDATGVTDTDGDGLPNTIDNCTNVSNPDQFDADGDGFGNNCDPDLNQSGLTTAADYTALRSYFNKTRAIPDLNRTTNPGTGLITAADYTVLRAAFNKIPGPSGRRPACVSASTCSGPPTPGSTSIPTSAANVY